MIFRSEAELEAHCMDLVTDRGGEHRKLDTGPNSKGWLDQVVWLPGGVHFIAEFKMPGNTPSPMQRRRIEKLRGLGVPVYVVDSAEGFRAILRRCALSV